MKTKSGHKHILEHLAGLTGEVANAIALGVSNKAATVDDTELGFEISRQPIRLTSVDYDNNRIIFIASFPAEMSFRATELGLLFTPDTSIDNYVLNFDKDEEFWSVGTSIGNSSIGANNLALSVSGGGASTELRDISIDLSAAANNGKLSLMYTGYAGLTTINIVFQTDDNNKATLSFAGANGAQSKVITTNADPAQWSGGTLNVVGSPDWSNITSITVEAVGSNGTIVLDGLAFNEISNDTLVTRTVLAQPLIKLSEVPLEVEFSLDVTV